MKGLHTNNYSTIRDVPFSGLELHVSQNRSVMAQNTHCSLFPVHILCILTCTCLIQKLQVVYGCSAYPTTALPLETFLEWFRVAWENQLESYSPRFTHRLFSDTTFACVLQTYTYIPIWCATTCNNKTHVAYACTTHETMVLLPRTHHFITTKSYVQTYELLQSIASTYMWQCLPNYSGCH